MTIKFSHLGLLTLYLIIIWQIENRVYTIEFAPYFLSLLISLILLLRVLVNNTLNKKIITAFTISLLLFLIAAWSINYSIDTDFSTKSLATFSFRLLVLILAAIVVSDSNAKYLLEKVDILWFLTLTVILLWLIPGFFKYFDLIVNYQNAGAAIMICLLPILIHQQKYWKACLTTIVILVLGSRMATSLLILMYVYIYLFYFLKLKVSSTIFILSFISLLIFILFLSNHDWQLFGVVKEYNPLALPELEKGDADYGRRIHNYHGVNLLKEHWLTGVGIGSFQLHLFELTGRAMSPHSFIFFFVVQMGILSLVLYLILVYLSVKPLWFKNNMSSRKLTMHQAIGLSNLLSFGYFFTRPQLDNILYFMLMGMAIGMNLKSNQHTKNKH